MSRVLAYCRVSTPNQVTANQRREIAAAGFSIESRRVIEESISGSVASSERPGFQRLMDRLEPGDVLLVTKLDRLGRNAMDDRGREGLSPPRPPNRAGGSPAHGSPVSGFLIGSFSPSARRDRVRTARQRRRRHWASVDGRFDSVRTLTLGLLPQLRRASAAE